MLDVKSTVESPSADASFDPYGRLLRMLMPSLRGVVVHDGFANLVWASDEWDLADEPDVIKESIANALSDTAEFAGGVLLRDPRRAHRAARRRQFDREIVRHADRATRSCNVGPR